MKEKKPLTRSPRYRSFILERDHALEKILYRYLSATHQVTDKLKEKVLLYLHQVYQHQINFPSRQDLGAIEHRIAPEFRLAALRLTILFERLRRSTYMLAHLGEAEAIGRALGKVKNHYVPKEKLAEIVAHETPSEGTIQARVTLAVSRLQRDVMDAIQTSLVRESTVQEAAERVEAVFPKVVTYQRPPRILKNRKMAEADVYPLSGENSLSTGVLDDDQMEELVKDYLAENLPNDIFRRGPHDEMLFFDVEEEGDVEFIKRYEWELEQEITEDFVSRVREGSVDAAKENGINDLQWVAIVDNKTDECCLARDGMTSTEIESALDHGKLDSEECDAIVPSAHFNCRCVAVPMSEEMPDEEPADLGSFDDWLTEKAQG